MASLQVQVVNSRPVSGTGKESGKAYSFIILDVVVGMPDGSSRVAEMMVPAESKVENGKRYEIEFQPSISQQKKVEWRVSAVKGATGVVAPVKAA